jgi:hypothetical protein
MVEPARQAASLSLRPPAPCPAPPAQLWACCVAHGPYTGHPACARGSRQRMATGGAGCPAACRTSPGQPAVAGFRECRERQHQRSTSNRHGCCASLFVVIAVWRLQIYCTAKAEATECGFCSAVKLSGCRCCFLPGALQTAGHPCTSATTGPQMRRCQRCGWQQPRSAPQAPGSRGCPGAHHPGGRKTCNRSGR